MPTITIAELRSRIESALAADLGQYVYQDAAGIDQVPRIALRVDNDTKPIVDGQFWTQQPKTTGLEVVITPLSDTQFGVFACRQYSEEHTTLITLKQWDRTQSVSTATRLLTRELRDVIAPGGVGPKIPRNQNLDSLEAQVITVQHQL